MRAEHTGVVVARGIGLLLIFFAVSNAASALDLFFPHVTSGWTSYSPPPTPMTSVLHDTYFVTIAAWAPSLVQTFMGAGLILFSKPVGRWLAMGLKDTPPEN